MKPIQQRWIVILGAALGAVYGLLARFVFGLHTSRSTVFAVMSLSFVFGVPIALGFLTVWVAESQGDLGWWRRILLPWVATLTFLGGCLLLLWEGVICVILMLPEALVLSSLGGILAWLMRLLVRKNRSKASCVAVVALLPFAAAPIEHLRKAASEIRTVNTQIDIRADPHTVWEQIRSVPRIREDEQFFDLTHLMGFPRPLEARLVGRGVGAVRHATFEKGVLFIETITAWKENERLAFSIHADTDHIPPTTFDDHVRVGGPYFDVLEGTYWLEPLGPHLVRLHLLSRQRLSTRFNFYSRLWTEYLMADLQRYILTIIKRRCEHQAPSAAAGTRGVPASPAKPRRLGANSA
jgi:hypothetical protein